MDEFLVKSQFNETAATLLYNNHLYDSVFHPIYYSCLQLIIHKLIKKGITLDQQSTLIASRYKGNSHRCLIEESKKQITFNSIREKKEYGDNIKQLKDFREKADYKECRINQSQCCDGINIAILVRQKINSI